MGGPTASLGDFEGYSFVSPKLVIDRGPITSSTEDLSPRGPHLAQDGPEDAVDKPRRVGTAELLGRLDRLVDRTLGGDPPLPRNLIGVKQFGQSHPENRAFERRDAIERPSARVGRYQLVKLRLAILHELGK